ncbi:tetratricopeptide repeat protein [Desulfosudis oleivorans]|nr:tetratricopeptide repeat protein [Desulfosudis oleivorans]
MNRMTISILLVVSILTFNSAFLCADSKFLDSSKTPEKEMDYKFIAPKTTIETGVIMTKDGQNIVARKISEDNNVIVYYLGHIAHGITVDKVLSIANTSGSGLIGFSEGDRRDSLNGSGFQAEPKTSITKVENLDDVNFIDGGKFFEKGNYTEAIQAYSLYLRYYPKSPTGYSNLGLCYLQKGNFKEALKYHTKAIELDDNRANLYIARSVSYWKMGLNDLAFADIEKAIELNPNNKDAYLKKGKFLFNKEEYKNAIKPFLKYLELGGNNWEALSALGWAYHKTDNDRDALKYLMIAHQSNEGSYDNNIRMADVYRGLKEYENAIKYYTLALNTDKKDIFLYLYRGISYMEKGDYSLAELDFKKALELKENDPVVLCNYAQLYIYQDKDRKAIPLLKKVLEVSKDEECNIWSKFTLEEISKSRKKTRNVIALFLIFIALIFLILLGVLKLKKSAGLMRVNVTKKLKYISTATVLMCGVMFFILSQQTEKSTERAKAEPAIRQALQAVDLGRYSIASDFYHKAIEFDPDRKEEFDRRINAMMDRRLQELWSGQYDFGKMRRYPEWEAARKADAFVQKEIQKFHRDFK